MFSKYGFTPKEIKTVTEQWRQQTIRSTLNAEVAIHGIKDVARRFGMSQAYIKAVINKNALATVDLSTKLGLLYCVGVDMSNGADHTGTAIIDRRSGQIAQIIIDEVES